MAVRAKKCAVCRDKFNPWNTLQKVCGVKCAHKFARDQEAKKQKASDKVRLEKLKTARDYIKPAQEAFNAYIRERDADKPCISCGRNDGDFSFNDRGGVWDCGHYRSRGSCPELRFDPLNAHRQCKTCNRDKSGNIVEYRMNLLDRIGQEALDWLEGPHEPKKYTIDELKDIAATYRRLKRELKKAA